MRLLAIGELLLAGLYAVSNIAGLLAIFMAAGTISQEVEQGTLQSILAKPVSRTQVVLGKWLGGTLMLATYVVVTGLVAAGIVYWRAGYLPAQLPLGLLLLTLKTTLLYSLTMVGSSLVPAITTGIVMLIVYVVANVTGMIEQVGVAIGSETMVRIGVIASLLIPSDALWKMGAAVVQPPNPLPALGLQHVPRPVRGRQPAERLDGPLRRRSTPSPPWPWRRCIFSRARPLTPRGGRRPGQGDPLYGERGSPSRPGRLRLPGHHVGVLHRLPGGALAQVVRRPQGHHQPGRRVDQVGDEGQVRARRPLAVHAPAPRRSPPPARTAAPA